MIEVLLMDLALMFFMGFLGSLHCVGMCGGLVTAIHMGSAQSGWWSLLIYQLGRVATYSVLGLVVGVSGAALSSLGGDIIQRLLAVVAGLMMMIFALNLGGWLPDPLRRFSGRVAGRIGLAQLARRVAADSRSHGWYLLGMANGLLPCGLVYAALSMALARGDAVDAALMMSAFGFGTIPAMMLMPSLFAMMSHVWRGRLMRIAAVAILLLGLMTLLRSAMPMM